MLPRCTHGNPGPTWMLLILLEDLWQVIGVNEAKILLSLGDGKAMWWLITAEEDFVTVDTPQSKQTFFFTTSFSFVLTYFISSFFLFPVRSLTLNASVVVYIGVDLSSLHTSSPESQVLRVSSTKRLGSHSTCYTCSGSKNSALNTYVKHCLFSSTPELGMWDHVRVVAWHDYLSFFLFLCVWV